MSVVGRQPSGRRHTVQMRMVQQGLSPGLQDGDKADVGPQVFWVAGDGQQSLGGSSKQKTVEHSLVLQRQRAELIGQREDEVKVEDVEQVGAALLTPVCLSFGLALRTMAIAALPQVSG